MLEDYFEDTFLLFFFSSDKELEVATRHIESQLLLKDSEHLEREFIDEKVFPTIYCMRPTKALGLYGFHVAYYKNNRR